MYILEKSFKLILGDTLAHRRGRAHTARDHLQHVVDIVGAGPFLMGDDINFAFDFRFLNKFSIGTHALLSKCFGELIGDQSRGMQTGKRNELPAVAQLGKALDVGFLLVAWHSCFPIEGWRKIVG